MSSEVERMKLLVFLTEKHWDVGIENRPIPLGEITITPGVSTMHSLSSPVMVDGKPYYLKVYANADPTAESRPQDATPDPQAPDSPSR